MSTMTNRVLAWIVAVGLIAGVGAIVVAYPSPAAPQGAHIEPVGEEVVPGPIELACAGPLTVGTKDASETGDDGLTFDPEFDPNRVPSIPKLTAVSVAPEGQGTDATVRHVDETSGEEFKASGDIGTAAIAAPKNVTVLSAKSTPDGMPLLAGAVVSKAQSGDLRGLAGAACQPAMADAYLVGGDTQIESTANLYFANLGSTSADVSVTVWGLAGLVKQLSSGQIVVPKHSQRVLQLPGIAPDEERVVVRVQVSGGSVATYMQDSRMNGTVPLGADYVVPGQGPATRAVIPALRINKVGEDAAVPAIVRLLAPGNSAATVTVRLVGPKGPIDPPGLEEIPLDAGVVSDIKLTDIPAGTYTAYIESNVPIVAGAMISDPSESASKPVERSWIPTVVPAASGLLALDALSDARLELSALKDTSVTLTGITADGKRTKAKKVDVKAERAQGLPVHDLGEKLAAVEYRSDQPIGIAAVLSEKNDDGDLLTVLTPAAAVERQTSIPIGVGTRLGLS